MTDAPDVAVVGAGIVGCALAAFLAEAGASVLVVERDGVAAAASGRNSGVVQHPMDAALAPLFEESLRHYRGLGVLPDEPRGILMLSPSGVPDELEPLRAAFPELRPEPLAAGEPARLEPALAPDLAGLRLDTGYPVGPTAATNAFADRARAAGASIVTGAAAALAPGGLMVAGERRPRGRRRRGGGAVDSGARRSRRRLAPDRAALGSRRRASAGRAAAPHAGGGRHRRARRERDPAAALQPRHARRGVRARLDVPARAPGPRGVCAAPARARRPLRARRSSTAPIGAVRACARPLSADGLPLLGRAPGRDDVFVAAGHGPWGISTGPASARLVADMVLGRADGPPAEFDPGRFTPA